MNPGLIDQRRPPPSSSVRFVVGDVVKVRSTLSESDKARSPVGWLTQMNKSLGAYGYIAESLTASLPTGLARFLMDTVGHAAYKVAVRYDEPDGANDFTVGSVHYNVWRYDSSWLEPVSTDDARNARLAPFDVIKIKFDRMERMRKRIHDHLFSSTTRESGIDAWRQHDELSLITHRLDQLEQTVHRQETLLAAAWRQQTRRRRRC
jgi:hypothetical protein